MAAIRMYSFMNSVSRSLDRVQRGVLGGVVEAACIMPGTTTVFGFPRTCPIRYDPTELMLEVCNPGCVRALTMAAMRPLAKLLLWAIEFRIDVAASVIPFVLEVGAGRAARTREEYLGSSFAWLSALKSSSVPKVRFRPLGSRICCRAGRVGEGK